MKSYRQNETKNQRKDRKRSATDLGRIPKFNTLQCVVNTINDYRVYVNNAKIYGHAVACAVSAARESTRRAMMLAKAGRVNGSKECTDSVCERVISIDDISPDVGEIIEIINDDETLSFKLERTTWKEPGNG